MSLLTGDSVFRFGNKTPTAEGEAIQIKKRTVIIGLLGLALGVWRLPIVSAVEDFVYTANDRGHSLSAMNVGPGHVKNIVTHALRMTVGRIA